jgi:hypothetical protein
MTNTNFFRVVLLEKEKYITFKDGEYGKVNMHCFILAVPNTNIVG